MTDLMMVLCVDDDGDHDGVDLLPIHEWNWTMTATGSLTIIPNLGRHLAILNFLFYLY